MRKTVKKMLVKFVTGNDSAPLHPILELLCSQLRDFQYLRHLSLVQL